MNYDEICKIIWIMMMFWYVSYLYLYFVEYENKDYDGDIEV